MSTNSTRIAAPTISLAGTRRYDDGSTYVVSALEVDQRTPGGTPDTVTNIPVYNFVGEVTVTLSAPDGVTLKDYSSAPEESATNVTGMLQGDQSEGNILYYFGTKIPTPTEANVYTEAFKLVRPNYEVTGKFHVAQDDVVYLWAVVFVQGEVGIEAIAKIKVS